MKSQLTVATLILGVFVPITRAHAQYQPAWVENGMITFVRPVSDTTVMYLEVRYSPYHAATEPSVSYELHALRCATSTAPIDQAFMAAGDNEVTAVKPRNKGEMLWKQIPFGFQDEESARATMGCIQLDRRRKGR